MRYPLLRIWITQGLGRVRLARGQVPAGVYRVLGVLTVGVFAAGRRGLGRARRTVDMRVLGFLALVCLAAVCGLHWTDYRHASRRRPGFIQGRYLFPPSASSASRSPGACRAAASARRAARDRLMLGGLLVFHPFALGLVLERFYA